MKKIMQSCLAMLSFLGITHYQKIITDKSEIKAIVFDLDGVLFTTSKKMYAGLIPYFPLYLAKRVFNGKNLHVKEHYLEIISQVKGKSTMKSFHQGKPMPQIMVDWQTGTAVAETVNEHIKNDITLSYAEKKLMSAIARRVFDPKRFINSRTPIKQGVQLVKALKKAGYKVYVLSNWDAQSFSVLQKKYSDIMNLFDGVCTSGETGFLKPNPEIFHAFLEKFQLKAKECLFIDDEPHNIYGAESVGIRAILFDAKKSSQAVQSLQEMDILKTAEQ